MMLCKCPRCSCLTIIAKGHGLVCRFCTRWHRVDGSDKQGR